jgi:hypothetical protein
MMTVPTDKESRRELVKLHLFDEQLIAIGHVAVRSAMLDNIIDFTVEAISKSYPKVMRDESLRFSVQKKLSLITQELVKLIPHHESAITEFISEVHAARKERNDMIHRMWGTTETDYKKILIDMRHWIKQRPPRRVTADKMMALATKMIDLVWELVDWKVLSDHLRLRQFGPMRGIKNPPLGPLPDPPRTSSKDAERREEKRRQQRSRMK